MDSLVYDLDMATSFYKDVVQSVPFSEFDTDFFCIAARKKYLSESQRELIKLGDTSLLEKVILKTGTADEFRHKLLKYDSSADHMYSFSGDLIPRECMCFYLNLNHGNIIKIMQMFKQDLVSFETELFNVLTGNHHKDPIGKKLKGLDTLLLKSYQNPSNSSKKTWVDIDIDSKDSSPEEINQIMVGLGFEPGSYCIVITRGGYHLICDTRFMKKYNSALNMDPNELKNKVLSIDKVILALRSYFTSKEYSFKEIMINQNLMVPIPGTIQGGFHVGFYRGN